MAIDTRAKRFSMLNFSWVPSVVLFEADSTVDADDKSHMLNLYSGISLDNPAAAVGQRSRLLLLGVGQ